MNYVLGLDLNLTIDLLKTINIVEPLNVPTIIKNFLQKEYNLGSADLDLLIDDAKMGGTGSNAWVYLYSKFVESSVDSRLVLGYYLSIRTVK
jgi:hypothetical protein